MRVVIIGGTGHIGSYLVPRLVEVGYEVVVISRGKRDPYHSHPAWTEVEHIPLNRKQEEREGTFGKRVLGLDPEVVVDLICFTVESCQGLVEPLRGKIRHFLHCGTIWVYGHAGFFPTTEEAARRPLGVYGKKKAGIEKYLLSKVQGHGFPATILHPGHIVGQGWVPINPAGNLNERVFSQLARGEPVQLPHLGCETLHHVHADDVAQAFERSIERRTRAVGEVFNVVSPQALSMRRYAERVAEHYGQEAVLEFLSWSEWKKSASKEDADLTWDHIRHSPCCSNQKARDMIGFSPQYSAIEAVFESLDWLGENGS